MNHIKTFYDADTSTLTYVVYDERTKDAVVIDPVLDYDPKASKVTAKAVNEVTAFVKAEQLNLRYILETHAHADHLSGAQLLKRRFEGATVAIGEHITKVQAMFKTIFDLPQDFATDGSQFDRLLADGERLEAGSLLIEVIYTPGHTPACVSYLIDDALFTGDTIFMPDMGTGRCDFPGGSAAQMYSSIHERLYALPDQTRVFVGHDYQPGGRALAYETTIAKSKADNVQLSQSTTEAQYLEFRQRRDATLDAPRLLFQSVQVNVDAGHLPSPHPNALRYLRIPINVFRPEVDADALELQKI